MTPKNENEFSHFLAGFLNREHISVHVLGARQVFEKKLTPFSLDELSTTEALVYVASSATDEAIAKAKTVSFVVAHSKWKDALGLPNSNQFFVFTDFPEAFVDLYIAYAYPSEWAGLEDRTLSRIHSSALIEAGVVVGPECEISQGVVLESGVRLGRGVFVGENTRIGANTKIADGSVIGKQCSIGANNVIGGQGFGLIPFAKGPSPRPRRHIGRVVIEDYVRTGAFVAIDRAVFGETRVGEASCLDNVIQVAHNSRLGKNNVLCGFVGLAGSTTTGNRVTMAGMSASGGHLHIADNVTLAGQTGVNANIETAGTYKGYPPRPLREALKIDVLIGKLPEIVARIKKLEDKLL